MVMPVCPPARLPEKMLIYNNLTFLRWLLDIIGHVKLIKEADKLGTYLYKLCQNT